MPRPDGQDADARRAAVAIVGTRRASPEGLEIARTLGRGLAGAEVTVVSGLALGVDSAAHAGAVEVCGPTVAVLGGGADVPYPTRKAGLYEAILAAGGVVISEMPPGFRAFRWNFPARNRIIAALAPATIVVEAAERSGSLITAELALELGRDVAAVPGPVPSWRSRGTNALLRDGATLIRDVRDALELVLGIEGAAAALERAAAETIPPPTTLAPELRALLAAVEDGRDSIASLASDAAGAAIVRAGLTELELLGLVRRVRVARVLRTTRRAACDGPRAARGTSIGRDVDRSRRAAAARAARARLPVDRRLGLRRWRRHPGRPEGLCPLWRPRHDGDHGADRAEHGRGDARRGRRAGHGRRADRGRRERLRDRRREDRHGRRRGRDRRRRRARSTPCRPARRSCWTP